MAIPVTIPHFDLPFRIVNGSFAVVEQDTHEDISNCVEAILRTPYGYRVQDGKVDFGIYPPTFELQPVDLSLIKANIGSQEPRAEVVLSENPDAFDPLIQKITAEI